MCITKSIIYTAWCDHHSKPLFVTREEYDEQGNDRVVSKLRQLLAWMYHIHLTYFFKLTYLFYKAEVLYSVAFSCVHWTQLYRKPLLYVSQQRCMTKGNQLQKESFPIYWMQHVWKPGPSRLLKKSTQVNSLGHTGNVSLECHDLLRKEHVEQKRESNKFVCVCMCGLPGMHHLC